MIYAILSYIREVPHVFYILSFYFYVQNKERKTIKNLEKVSKKIIIFGRNVIAELKLYFNKPWKKWGSFLQVSLTSEGSYCIYQIFFAAIAMTSNNVSYQITFTSLVLLYLSFIENGVTITSKMRKYCNDVLKQILPWNFSEEMTNYLIINGSILQIIKCEGYDENISWKLSTIFI